MKWEFDAAGIPWEPFGARARRLEETITELRRFFSTELAALPGGRSPVPVQRVGFDAAPRHLGIDEQGRDVLDFMDGDVPGQLVGPEPDRRDPGQSLFGNRRGGHGVVSGENVRAGRTPRQATSWIVCVRSGPTETIDTGTPVCLPRNFT